MKSALLLTVTLLCAQAVFNRPPITQDLNYHNFADTSEAFGIPNWQNVLSNIPFAIIGLLGVVTVVIKRKESKENEHVAWLLVFLGVALTAFGSAYYHWDPNNATLLWDRLPMSVAFTALFASIIGERIGLVTYNIVLWSLVSLGVGSVIFWYAGETSGHGDLRPYVFVQFFPLICIPIIMLIYKPRYSHSYLIGSAIAAYAAAKALEYFDQQVFVLTSGFIAGHALKHLAAAVGSFSLLMMYRKRSRLGGEY